MKKAVIFDMDGTLVDVSKIRHFVHPEREGGRNFHAFHMESASSPPNTFVVQAAQQAHREGLGVLIVTARKARYRHVTAMWLALHHVPSDALYMRADGDDRPDFLAKEDILQRIRLRWNPVHAWDDNPAVLALWRREGIPHTVVPGWTE